MKGCFKNIGPICFSLIVTSWVLVGCGYSGPGMGVVMSQCSYTTKFPQFYSCVVSNWYNPVVASGNSNNMVEFAMSAGRNLYQGVQSGQIADAQAIYQWQVIRNQMRDQELGQMASDAAALQSLQRILNQQQQTTTPSTQRHIQRGYLKGEQRSGVNKICYYDDMGSTVATTVGATDICPLTIQ